MQTDFGKTQIPYSLVKSVLNEPLTWLDTSKLTCKALYSHLIQKYSVHSRNKLLKWFNNLNVTALEPVSECRKIWINVYNLTKETKLREFQWKILHRLIPCNKYLYFWKLKDSMYCPICQQIDSLEHRYLHCQIAVRCWKRVQSIISRYFEVQVELTPANIIFSEVCGDINFKKHDSVVNLLILLGKWSIHKFWIVKANTPVEVILKNEFISRYNIEKYMVQMSTVWKPLKRLSI